MAGTVFITGSTDGIGFATALGLAQRGWRVLVHGRNRPRVDAALAQLRAAHATGAFDGVSFDLATAKAIATGAAQVRALAPQLDALICNAGIFAPERTLTDDGVELTLAVNYLGHVRLEHALAPSLAAATAPQVVHVSSVAHSRGRIALDLLGGADSGYTGYAAYAQSKLAQVIYVMGQAHARPGVCYQALHPGVISTKLLRQGFGPLQGGSPSQGATTSIALLTGDLVGPSGSYFSEGRLAEAGTAAHDPAAQARLAAFTRKFVDDDLRSP